MTKDQKIGVMWKLLFGTVTCLFFALPALSDSSKLTKTSCQGEFSKQSTLPTSYKCNMVRLPDGTMLQTVPKLFSPPAVVAGKFPGKHIICRIPDCGKNLCKNGWCEETLVGYNCTCSSGFQGRHCDEQSTKDATTKPTMSYTKTMTERSDTTTFQSTTTSEWEAKTKSAMSPTATMPERSDTTTSQETTTSMCLHKTATRPMTTVSAATTSPETTASNSTGLSTADATNKTTMSPTTTMSDTTTSQDTTTSKSTKEATTKPTTSSTTTMTERSDTTTSQSTATSEWVQTEAKTKSATSPTATMPGRSDPTTSQETTTSKSVESSTTDATTKPMTSPTTAMSDTTTSQDTITSTCSSPLVDCKFGGSFYNISIVKMNHASAVSACSQFGSHLVFIESQEEEDFIARSAQYISNLNINRYWIGLTGSSLSEARWLDGSSLTYSNFNQNSFDDNVNCFLIKCEDQYSPWWHDRDCSIQFRFICEKEVGI